MVCKNPVKGRLRPLSSMLTNMVRWRTYLCSNMKDAALYYYQNTRFNPGSGFCRRAVHTVTQQFSRLPSKQYQCSSDLFFSSFFSRSVPGEKSEGKMRIGPEEHIVSSKCINVPAHENS